MIKKETFLEDIQNNLIMLCEEMESVYSTNILYGYDETHISRKSMIHLCLNYIERVVKDFNKIHVKELTSEIIIPYFTSEGVKFHRYPKPKKT